MNKIKGYTLIELLIVMTIVVLLSGISLFALQGSRRSARDAQRKGDLESIRSALELYRSDCNEYPSTLPSGSLTSNTLPCSITPERTYLTDIPGDPTGGNYVYNRLTDYTYQLCAKLEEAPAVSQNCGGDENYRVTNP